MDLLYTAAKIAVAFLPGDTTTNSAPVQSRSLYLSGLSQGPLRGRYAITKAIDISRGEGARTDRFPYRPEAGLSVRCPAARRAARVALTALRAASAGFSVSLWLKRGNATAPLPCERPDASDELHLLLLPEAPTPADRSPPAAAPARWDVHCLVTRGWVFVRRRECCTWRHLAPTAPRTQCPTRAPAARIPRRWCQSRSATRRSRYLHRMPANLLVGVVAWGSDCIAVHPPPRMHLSYRCILPFLTFLSCIFLIGDALRAGRGCGELHARVPPPLQDRHGAHVRRPQARGASASPPSLPYKVDTSRPSLRTNWTRLVPSLGNPAEPSDITHCVHARARSARCLPRPYP